MDMELVALILAIFRKPIALIVGAVILIGFARDNPWTAVLFLGAVVALLAALVAATTIGTASDDEG